MGALIFFLKKGGVGELGEGGARGNSKIDKEDESARMRQFWR